MEKIITARLVQEVIQKRNPDTHKGNYGRVMIIGGNHQYGGAAILSASAAVYAGSGLVTLVTDEHNFAALHARLPEAMVLSFSALLQRNEFWQQMNVIVIGPGLGLGDTALALLKMALRNLQVEQTLIIDGSALTLLAEHHLSLPEKGKVILTPHQMEWQRVSQIPLAEQSIAQNAEMQQKLGAIVVLKGHRTHLYFDNEVWENPCGGPALATGGSGDTLTGIIAAFLAQFKPRKQALLAAVYVHSALSDLLAQQYYVTLPTKIIEELPIYMKKIITAESI